MISDIDKYVDFLATHQISEHQFLILWLVQTKDKKNIAKYKKRFGNFNVEAILDLIDRGWIQDFGVVRDGKMSFNIYDFLITDKFSKEILVDEEDAYEELCKVYVRFIEVNGIKYPAITGDPMKLGKDYWQSHKGNKTEHLRILELTKAYVNDNTIQKVKIENYIKNKMWKLVEGSGSVSGDPFTIV